MKKFDFEEALDQNWLLFVAVISEYTFPKTSKKYLWDVLGWIRTTESYLDSAEQLVLSAPVDVAKKMMAAVNQHIEIYSRDPEGYRAFIESGTT